MAVKGQSITTLVSGDSWRIERTYTLPTGLDFTKVYLTIKAKPSHTDARALVQKSITTVLGASGQITDADSDDGNIDLFFLLTPEETELVRPNIKSWYDICGIADDGGVYTFETESYIEPLEGVTDATS